MASYLIETTIHRYHETVVSTITELAKNFIYVSFNKPSDFTKQMLEAKGLDLSNVKFLDCVKSHENGPTVDPANLTDLSMTLGKLIGGMTGEYFLLVDTISAFAAYHNVNTILKFVGSVNSLMQENKVDVVWLTIADESEKELNDKVAPLCDKVVNI